jgi:hypothetical protein
MMAICVGVVGALVMVAGSMGIAMAPGDGQTGMCCCPFWAVGGLLVVASIILACLPGASATARWVVAAAASAAVVSMAWSAIACVRYERRRERERTES